jgi:cytochrome c-type biogenesis protein CcmH/NrfF
MTVERAVMRERLAGARFPQAQHAWNAVRRGLQNEDMSPDAIRDQLVEKYGDEVLLDPPFD